MDGELTRSGVVGLIGLIYSYATVSFLIWGGSPVSVTWWFVGVSIVSVASMDSVTTCTAGNFRTRRPIFDTATILDRFVGF